MAMSNRYGKNDLSLALTSAPGRPGSLEPILKQVIGRKNSESQNTTNFVTLTVANFPYGTTKEELYELFEDYDPIEILMIVNSPSQQHNYTFAYVVLPDIKRAENALFELDSTAFNRNELVVCYTLERIA